MPCALFPLFVVEVPVVIATLYIAVHITDIRSIHIPVVSEGYAVRPAMLECCDLVILRGKGTWLSIRDITVVHRFV